MCPDVAAASVAAAAVAVVLLPSPLIGSNYGSLVWPVFEVCDKDKSRREQQLGQQQVP